MARLPRLVLPGFAHFVILLGHGGRAVFADDAERQAFSSALREAAAAEQVQLHAYALLDHEVQLLATPATASGLGRMMQALGRRYVAACNRRHGRMGSPWEGRFRCAMVQPGATLLDVMRIVDGQADTGASPPALLHTSAGHRCGQHHLAHLVDPPEYWQLGNTPFEREIAYRTLLANGLSVERSLALRSAALGGWVAGDKAFAAEVEALVTRPTAPRPRGRPRRQPG